MEVWFCKLSTSCVRAALVAIDAEHPIFNTSAQDF